MFGLSDLATKLLTAAVEFVIVVALGAWGMHYIDSVRYEKLVARDAAAQAQAIHDVAVQLHNADQVTLEKAVADAQAQVKIVTRYQTITKEIPVHVSDSAHCITYGLVRVLNAAAGPGAYAVPDAASQPDDTCAPVTWRSFADDLTADYGAKAANDQQLSDLQAWVTAQAAETRSAPSR